MNLFRHFLKQGKLLSQHPACVKKCRLTSINFMLFLLVLLLVNTVKSHSLFIFMPIVLP